MKILYRTILSAVMATVLFAGCKKETTKNVSKIFTVPVIELKGDDVVILPVGGAYTDAGSDYTGEDGQVTALPSSSNNVNVNAPGLYFVNYEKESASGVYETEATRLVAVTSVNNPVDYSGTYYRALTNLNISIERVAPGVYKVTNPGGAATGTNVVVYFVETALNTFVAPSQPSTAGPFGVNEIAFTPTGVSWKVAAAGYGTGVRTFVKQ
jgi:Domain of unknown function (DUF5011)